MNVIKVLKDVLYISEHLRDLIADERIEKEELRAEVYGAGETVTLLQDALEKVLLGYTTFQEIYREVDIDVDLENAIKADMGYVDEEIESDSEEDEIDWNNFDGVFDDELDLIDISDDEDTLPTVDNSIIDVDQFRYAFNKNLQPSDPEFLKFFLLEDNKIMVEDVEKERQRLLEIERAKEE